MKTYRHPVTYEIRVAGDDEDVKIAALEKLGYELWTAKDVKNEPELSVVYEQVQDKHTPPEPPALPKLVVPAPSDEDKKEKK